MASGAKLKTNSSNSIPLIHRPFTCHLAFLQRPPLMFQANITPHGTHALSSDGWQEQLLRRKPQRWMSKLGHEAEAHPDLSLSKLATDLRADFKLVFTLEGNGEV